MKDKVVVITGASRGIGAEAARVFARSGAKVGLLARGEAEISALAAEIGAQALAVSCDVSDVDNVNAAIEAVRKAFGPIDVLINNAGAVDPIAHIATSDPEAWSRVIDINLVGAILTAREAARRLPKSKGGAGGSVVFLSSAAARLGGANNFADYAAAKGALDTLTKGLSDEISGDGVRVNAVRPGIIDTEIHADAGLPDRVAEIGHLQPMGRAGTAEETANAILWLLSDDASYTTGTHLDVSGGR